MSFIHVRISENSSSVKGSFRLDGGPVKFFKYGIYLEVDPGEHIIQVDNESTVWTVRETLNRNDDLEVILFVNDMYESICAPEYYVNRDLDAETIEYIKETIAENKRIEDERDEKELNVIKWVGVVLGIIWGLAVFIMSFQILNTIGSLAVKCISIVIWFGSICLARSCMKAKNKK